MPSSWFKTFMFVAAGVDLDNPSPRQKPKPGPPMDLGNMRQNGVRALAVRCLACDHRADVNVDTYPGHWAVKSFELRMKCSACGSKKIDVRPAWNTKPPQIPRP